MGSCFLKVAAIEPATAGPAVSPGAAAFTVLCLAAAVIILVWLGRKRKKEREKKEQEDGK